MTSLVRSESNTPQSHRYTMFALHPVWVPHPAGYVPDPKGRKGRAATEGPNGEPAASGKWKLLLPDGSIYNGPTISASALETSSECLTKWALDRLDGNEKPENRKATLGGERHAELERWIKYGTRPTTEGMAKVIEHFPMPGQMECEQYFGIVFGRPGFEIVFAGYLDGRESIVDERNYVVTEDEQGNELIEFRPTKLNSVVRDLKTTGDFRWKKTPAQLKSNVQAALYALGEMLRVEDHRRAQGETSIERIRCDAVVLKWTYAHLKELSTAAAGCAIKRVETVCECDACRSKGGSTADPEHARVGGVLITREEAVTTLAQYLPLAETLIEAIAAEKKAADVGKNFEACESYGGCPWKKIGLCEPPAGGGFKAMLKQERARLGVETGPSRVLVKLGDRSSGVETGPSKVLLAIGSDRKNTTALLGASEKRTSMTSLGSRFGVKNGATAAATPAAVVQAAVAPARVASTPAPAPAAGGLASRFAKKPTATEAKEEPAVALSVQATTKGMAASAEPTVTADTSTKDALKNRLQALQKGKAAAAVDKAPSHAVSASVPAVSTQALAVGINPPDAAPEWTPEQQAAEAERIAKRFGSVESGSADLLTPEPLEIAAGGEAAGESTEGTVAAPKRGRGRPKKASEASTTTVAAMETDECDPHHAQSILDNVAMRLMAGGYRREAAEVLALAAKLV